jgi:microcystin-dependent protein
MNNNFIGQLLLASWGFAPSGWSLCNGQILPINQYQALFSLLGTYYGGNGMTTFALPNLQGRAPIGFAPAQPIGSNGGEETHVLTSSEVPSHTHTLNAYASSDVETPLNNLLGGVPGTIFAPANNLVAMHNQTISTVGGQAHENRQPYLVMNWCIALNGIYPSRN